MVIVTIENIDDGKRDFQVFNLMGEARKWIEEQLTLGCTITEFKIHEILITWLPEITINYSILREEEL